MTVDDADDEPAYAPALERAGFAIRLRQPGHRMFRTPDQDVHVHVYSEGSDAARIRLLFRDWLRHNPEDRRLYEETKREFARREWEATNDYSTPRARWWPRSWPARSAGAALAADRRAIQHAAVGADDAQARDPGLQLHPQRAVDPVVRVREPRVGAVDRVALAAAGADHELGRAVDALEALEVVVVAGEQEPGAAAQRLPDRSTSRSSLWCRPAVKRGRCMKTIEQRRPGELAAEVARAGRGCRASRC